MSEFRVTAITKLHAEFRVPGDKSMSHRAAILGGLSDGTCTIRNFLPSEDCLNTLHAMQALGASVEVLDELAGFGPIKLRIHGLSLKPTAPSAPIDCGNSGTGMRLLAGLLAGQAFTSELFGDASLSSRPMGRITDPLGQMGAKIECLGEKPGCAPLLIHPAKLAPITYGMPVASAQVKSAVLLAGLFADGETTVIQPAETRDHTERMMASFGMQTQHEGHSISIRGGQIPHACDFTVPGDISSAAFWLVAAAALPGSRLLIRDVGLNPTRSAILKVLSRMGAHMIDILHDSTGEPIGNIEIHGAALKATTIFPSEVPNLIDEIPVIAVAAALAEGRTIIRNARELRVKETDRITTVVNNLRAMGAVVEEFEDGMEIEGGHPLHAAEIDSFGDHRIAMAFAIAGLFAKGETVIRNTDCVNTSYPGFSHHLAAILRECSDASDFTLPLVSNSKHFAIAIDGPAASGKSTLARRLAQRLGLIMVNSGAMYRAVTWRVLKEAIDPLDAASVISLLERIDIRCGSDGSSSTITIDGIDPGNELRSEAVNANVSAISAIPEVRKKLIHLQRAYLEHTCVVMEGRDIGSVVFPDTPFKLYVDAAEHVRAARRGGQGQVDSIAKRDAADSGRKTAPLKVADGATILDTSDHSIESGVEAAIEILKQQGFDIPASGCS
ncbi:MAG: 3-phosphoshikimate 1-carboxyvinyltransferase [Luteolibacter sp.]|jgi:3-phosphoshikimate 1-carboxyvinyltransferase|nr:3-phosphoshikimate 1-carboxyvinyltransferase [Luteolibacter sp.]